MTDNILIDPLLTSVTDVDDDIPRCGSYKSRQMNKLNSSLLIKFIADLDIDEGVDPYCEFQ
jgi:hypothetical protein